MFLGRSDDDSKRWSPRDRELAKALMLHEASLCPGCGQPAHETEDTDLEGWWQVETIPCTACQAIEDARDQMEPGDRIRVVLDPRYVKRS